MSFTTNDCKSANACTKSDGLKANDGLGLAYVFFCQICCTSKTAIGYEKTCVCTYTNKMENKFHLSGIYQKISSFRQFGVVGLSVIALRC